MTPAQLRAFATVVRLSSVKDAARELGVTEAAVSGHVGALRRELDDQLFTRATSGLAFTPGGLRLASRASEMLGLQDQTVREVSEAGHGRRLLRLATSSLFAEHGAAGLIQLFTGRARDLDVELSVRQTDQFPSLLTGRAVDIAIGPSTVLPPDEYVQRPFLKYQVAIVAGPAHPLALGQPRPDALRDALWLLGPSIAERDSLTRRLLRHFDVPEDRQRIFQSHAAALEEIKRNRGIGPAVTFAASDDLAQGRLVQVSTRGALVDGTWSATTLPNHSVTPAASELLRFMITPRATQAMLQGVGATIGHFRPSVHVTLWS